MKFNNLKSKQEFENLKKGDIIIVKWTENVVKHTPNCKEIEMYRIVENKKDYHEIICQKKGNHYFNYNLYLSGSGGALEVVQVLKEKHNEKHKN